MRHKLTIGNAAGLASSFNDLDKLCSSEVINRVTTPAIALDSRPGNQGQTYGFNGTLRASANSRGLPSLGLSGWSKILPYILDRCAIKGKKLVGSVVGFGSPDEWKEVLIGCSNLGFKHVELNLGCPNVWGETGRKPIPSYEPELAREILLPLGPTVRKLGITIGVKISPVDDVTLSALADVMDECRYVSEIVACNTIPDQDLLLEDGSHALAFKVGEDSTIRHLGGLAGEPLRPHSLRILSQLQLWLPRVPIIGCGGIFTSDHALEYIEHGASGFEVGTAYAEFGARVFDEIVAGLPVHTMELL